MAASLVLSRLVSADVEPAVVTALTSCHARNIRTAHDLFQLTDLQLCDAADLTLSEAKSVFEYVSRRLCPPSRRASEILRSRRASEASIATGLKPVDDALCGGVANGAITELVGRSGCGKTQLCLTLSAMVGLRAARRLQSGVAATPAAVVYIDTERKFSAERLSEIFACQAAVAGLVQGIDVDTGDFMSTVQVFNETNSRGLLTRLKGLDDVVVTHGVRLIVVDSIACLARKDFGPTELQERQMLLSETAAALKYLAETFNLPVVVTNQVLSSGVSTSAALGDVCIEDGMVLPALGTLWSHCVNTRLALEMVRKDGGDDDDTEGAPRRLRISKSPVAPPIGVGFRIGPAGVCAE